MRIFDFHTSKARYKLKVVVLYLWCVIAKQFPDLLTFHSLIYHRSFICSEAPSTEGTEHEDSAFSEAELSLQTGTLFGTEGIGALLIGLTLLCSVGDPHVFGPPGSGGMDPDPSLFS